MRLRIAVVGALLVVGAAGIALAQGAPSIQGAWRVTEVTVTGANAATNKSPQPALYLFTKQHYSIVVVNGTSPRKNLGPAADPEKLTDAEKLARFEAYDPFVANSGTYEVSGGILTTHPLVAKNPGTMGTTQAREFRIDGTTLTLIQKSAPGPAASQTTTKLTRIE
jgi:hypothetical protein